MGMFDSFRVPIVCPYSGNKVKEAEFQTKEFQCELIDWRIGDEFTGQCCIKINDAEIHLDGSCRCEACKEWENQMREHRGYNCYGFGRSIDGTIIIKNGKVHGVINVVKDTACSSSKDLLQVFRIADEYGSHLHTIESGTALNAYLMSQWFDGKPFAIIDFEGVNQIGPRFARAAFRPFIEKVPFGEVLDYIKLINISDVKRIIIEIELKDTRTHFLIRETDKIIATTEDDLDNDPSSFTLNASLASLVKRKHQLEAELESTDE